MAAGPILTGSAGLLDSMPVWIRMESDQALGMTVNGTDEVRRAVRAQVKGGVDWIKVSASGVAGSRFATRGDRGPQRRRDRRGGVGGTQVRQARPCACPFAGGRPRLHRGGRALAPLGRVCRRGNPGSDAREGDHLQSHRRLAACALPARLRAGRESRFCRGSVAGVCGGQDIDRQGAGARRENGDGLGRLAPLSSCA